jgi:hypothetical protein
MFRPAYNLGEVSCQKSESVLQHLKLHVLTLLGLWMLLSVSPAQAVPSFAAQTGQSCVACHAGGQFPELTPYGRLFKLTGYTSGERANPLSAMVVADYTATQNPDDPGVKLDKSVILNSISVFLAGKVTDNVGGFAQYTHTLHDTQDASLNWIGHTGADNFDLRYADRTVDADKDLIWGVTLNNNPSVQDVWNSAPAWSHPYLSPTQAFGLPFSTLVEGALAQQVAGIGAYAYLNQSIYAEVTSYQTAKDAFSFLSYGSNAGNPDHPLTYLDGSALYWRVGYTKAWDASNVMVGAFGFDAKVLPLDGSNMPVFGTGSTHYKDLGLDAQYQYLLSPHTFTAQIRAVSETIDDATALAYSDGPATMNTLMAKVGYVYREKYGASLTYRNVSGSTDSTAYASGSSLLPDSEIWTPEFFWLVRQNVRLGLQFNLFSKYLGATSNYDGAGRNASDNNNTYLYLWAAF